MFLSSASLKSLNDRSGDCARAKDVRWKGATENLTHDSAKKPAAVTFFPQTVLI
jgi:hypothetical protein